MIRAFSAEAVRSAEAPLLAAGEPLMRRASYAIANRTISYLRAGGFTIPGSTVLALVGPGNNGGDALFASAFLADRGLDVTALYTGTVHDAGLAAARRAGVRLIELVEPTSARSLAELRDWAAYGGIWIDGLLGIGARGAAREPFATWISVLDAGRRASPDEPFIIAVDVPSGVSVDDGELPGPVLPASLTVATGCAKPAHLLPPARYVCGDVDVVDLGFDAHLPAQAEVCELSDADVADLWPVPGLADHKYTRGVVGLITGSQTYPGAGVLSVAGALAAGPGMVRYWGGSPHVVQAYPEVVPGSGQVHSLVVGSGLDDLTGVANEVTAALDAGIPVVLDAGAIELAYTRKLPEWAVLTPHAGELTALLSARGLQTDRAEVESRPAWAARTAATLTGASVVAKFATDVIASPSGQLYAQGGAPAWRATAGAGDVLAGLIGTVLAMNAEHACEPGQASLLAAAATHIHGQAAALAAGSGRPIRALDIAAHIPPVIERILT
ncbi:bifunctional ADP-dependent NAD(P)H-hydrate dehydratase/NAD(P)H-hydrate epimerase [Trueperella bialowiezensis]|uniref:Bifunctional NAD(P)H-hydrate repair enzyme n=1 Tax=Trueperella bialowiezensis TaxID=312285 RepID=A0A3S4VSK6_9ACTO|nr:bifunctional ADP-dependent NAD(P)H-hydrate dehydratase/NAD(P)H-hydrate epimerase [Trueperella bialowiezensis]VEI12807.1 Nicotinamide nucleotide repair protein [Trueperella bialowiezensis]